MWKRKTFIRGSFTGRTVTGRFTLAAALPPSGYPLMFPDLKKKYISLFYLNLFRIRKINL
jgi:hypothetical protein